MCIKIGAGITVPSIVTFVSMFYNERHAGCYAGVLSDICKG